jgi:hypothetical protein
MKKKDFKKSEGWNALMKLPFGKDFIQKVESDDQLDSDRKLAFFDFLSKYDSQVHKSINDYCEAFFRNGNKFLGKGIYEGDSNNPFVHIKDIRRLKEWMNQIVETNINTLIDSILDDGQPSDIRKVFFNALLNTKIRSTIENDPDECEKYLGVPSLSYSKEPIMLEAKLSSYAMWSFPLPSEANFISNNLGDLDCRSGLSEIRNYDKAVILLDLSEIKDIRKPTVFDAEFYPQFQPGGKTKPLDECSEKDGFDEYIHLPSKFKNITEIPNLIKK